MSKENYDPAMPVCNNQDDFNVALKKGIQYNNEEVSRQMSGVATVSLILYAIFLIWALMIVSKTVPKGIIRTQHILFAICASPIYVLSHYANAHMEDKAGSA
jgi:hypothetical protein